MIYLYTGNGEGKTSAALGHILRALGYEKRVLLIQFMKARETGEVRALKKLGVPVHQFGKVHFVLELDDGYKTLLRNGWSFFKKNWFNYDLVVLDEFAYVCSKGVFTEKDTRFLKEVSCDVIITGRDAPEFLISLSDMVSEIRKIKHPYDSGISAEKSLDY